MITAFIYVPGILSWPGDADGWTDRAVTWTHKHLKTPSEKFEYFSGVLTRRTRQQWRAEKLARMISFYNPKEFSLNLVGHSNGCDVIIRTMKLIDRPVNQIHLISAAADENMDNNRLPYYLSSGKVDHLYMYIAGRDWPLTLAARTAPILKLWGLGYGHLGLLDQSSIETAFSGLPVTIHREPFYGHSDWFTEENGNFEETMQLITGKVHNAKKVYPEIVEDAGLVPLAAFG
jgi:predicted alpha/beta hydrolase family esterase